MKGWNTICVVFAAFFSVFLCKTLLAGPVGQPSPVDTIKLPYSQGTRNVVMASGDACPTNKKGLISKTQTLHVPFITNNGQVDEQVKFYAKTFGGTVFVTKEGEIVYSLPSGRDVPAGASQEPERGLKPGGGGACRDALHASLLRADDANCPPDRFLTKELLAAYFPELQESTGRLVGTRCPCPPPVCISPLFAKWHGQT